MKYYSIILSVFVLSFVFSCDDEKEGALPEGFVFNVQTTIAENTPAPKIEYTLEIIAKDVPLGNVLWTKSIEMSKSKKIIIPDDYGHYTFKASKPGYIPHIQHFLGEELMDGNLSFEFIPESLEGFITKKSHNNVVTGYYPAYENRCKLYVRFDVAEGYYIQYKMADIAAEDEATASLANYIYTEWFQNRNTISLGNSNINMYYNRPFAEAIDYCQGVDLSISLIADEMDDVNFTSFMRLDFIRIDQSHSGNLNIYQYWKGLNNQ